MLYHIVSSAKYRRVLFTEEVDKVLISVWEETVKRYEIYFIEIGTDENHVHFLVQSVSSYSVTKIVTMLLSLTSREIFKECPDVKKQLWGGKFGEKVTLSIW